MRHAPAASLHQVAGFLPIHGSLPQIWYTTSS